MDDALRGDPIFWSHDETRGTTHLAHPSQHLARSAPADAWGPGRRLFAVAVLASLASVPAASARTFPAITGKLSKPGYTVVALASNGRATRGAGASCYARVTVRTHV